MIPGPINPCHAIDCPPSLGVTLKRIGLQTNAPRYIDYPQQSIDDDCVLLKNVFFILIRNSDFILFD